MKQVHPNNWINDLTAKEWVKATRSWVILDARSEPGWKELKKQHPGTFPIVVPEHFIPIFSKKYDTVLDPFAGSGTTMIAASRVNRYSIGIDLQQKYADLFKDLMSQHYLHPKQTMLVDTPEARKHRSIWSPVYRVGDSIEIMKNKIPDETIDYIITSPPYSNVLRDDPSKQGQITRHKQRKADGFETYYSDDAEDLGNLEDDGTWLDRMVLWADECARVIKPRRFMTIVIQNIMGIDFKPLAWDLARCIDSMTPWRLAFEMIWLQSIKPARIHGHPSRFLPSNHHHYVLNFQHTPAGSEEE